MRTASEPVYTVDWTTEMIPAWVAHLAPMRALDSPRFLEIGAYEGRTTRWLLETFPHAGVTVVEPFTGASDQSRLQINGMFSRFETNLGPFAGRVQLFADTSVMALPALLAKGERFDFIYVDGSHEAADVLFDACCAYHLCMPGGRICFDDYSWGHPGFIAQFTPKAAIDAFMSMHADRVRRLGIPDRQYWMEKDRTTA